MSRPKEQIYKRGPSVLEHPVYILMNAKKIVRNVLSIIITPQKLETKL